MLLNPIHYVPDIHIRPKPPHNCITVHECFLNSI